MVSPECNPEWASVSLVGYKFFREIALRADVTLVTHERNRAALERAGHSGITFIPESRAMSLLYRAVGPITSRVWPVHHLVTYPVYAEFNRRVRRLFGPMVEAGAFDIVHGLTPIMPRFPVALAASCKNTPFLFGPLNGGVPYPAGFSGVAKREFAFFNFLRVLVDFLPGYTRTYRMASHILAGSTYTMNFLKNHFDLPDDRITLFFENGVDQSFFAPVDRTESGTVCRLLFVGRLVPYKGADMLVEAIGRLPMAVRNQVHLTVVGDGDERRALEQQVMDAGLTGIVEFTGWVSADATLQFYARSDVFCFPSVREFGGAVVMEAMATGLPSIVVDNGGIAEYVTKETGFKIPPKSREDVVEDLVRHITCLAVDPALRERMGNAARTRASAFEWGKKGAQVVSLYREVLDRDPRRTSRPAVGGTEARVQDNLGGGSGMGRTQTLP
ncbi:MAG: glycosyltransferase family 4 protein [Burkholderiales bacterium]|nr:glycosyltransferase family 4 protein [Burkholderiales bacterium]